MKDERDNIKVPLQSEVNSKDGEFTTYDTTYGHCGLCGLLTCKGFCFK
jgi:hypothetical protein